VFVQALSGGRCPCRACRSVQQLRVEAEFELADVLRDASLRYRQSGGGSRYRAGFHDRDPTAQLFPRRRQRSLVRLLTHPGSVPECSVNLDAIHHGMRWRRGEALLAPNLLCDCAVVWCRGQIPIFRTPVHLYHLSFFNIYKETPMKLNRRLVLALVAAAVTVSGAAIAQQRMFFGVATGGTGGTYYPLGGMLAQLISNKAVVDGKKITATAEAGGASVANAKLLGNKDIESAFVAADILDAAYNGKGQFVGAPIKNLRA
jgi:hypothetical protein